MYSCSQPDKLHRLRGLRRDHWIKVPRMWHYYLLRGHTSDIAEK